VHTPLHRHLKKVSIRVRLGDRGGSALGGGGLLLSSLFSLSRANAEDGAEVDQHIDKGVLVGDCLAVAQLGMLDAKLDSLGVDPFGNGTLLVDELDLRVVAVELVADASPLTGGHGDNAAALWPVFVGDGAGMAGWFREEERAGIATALVHDQGRVADEGGFDGHGQHGLAEGETGLVEGTGDAPPFGKGDGGEATGLVEVLVDVVGVKGRVESAETRRASESSFRAGHEGKKVGGIALVEGLGEFGKDKFPPAVDLGADDA